MRVWGAALYAQDEWRARRGVTLNYGVRYERINPFTEIEDRLNALRARDSSRPSGPTRRAACVFPGDDGVGKGIAHQRQRVHAARRASPGIRPATASGRCGRATGCSTTSSRTAPAPRRRWRSARRRAAQFNQYSGAGLNFQNPYLGRPLPEPDTFVRPADRVRARRRRQAAVRPELERRRPARAVRPLPRRGRGTSAPRARNLPRNVEANPAVYGPGATAQNADRRRIYANCPGRSAAPATSPPSRCCATSRASSYHAGQFSLSRRYASGVGFNVSYWLSQANDYLSSMNLSGAAAKPLAGENDLAQNPFDLEAEYGPSLFDARHRFVASVQLAGADAGRGAPAAVRRCSTTGRSTPSRPINSGTPFTVSDSANVALQANSPPISGLPREPPEPRRRSERRAAHGRRVAQPRRVPAAQRADAGRPVRQRRPQHRARTRLRERRRVARARLHAVGRHAPAVPRRGLQRAQPRQLRPAGGRPQLAELRPHLLRRSAAADAVRAEADRSDARGAASASAGRRG